MSDGGATLASWPADIIHVNEDGWVLVNRGRRHGVTPGLRLLVVGQGIRELRDLYSDSATEAEPPVALRIRRTYEQLEVIHAEDDAAIAIATRTPPERRPQVFTGPDGELLVWVPLPSGFSWPPAGPQDDADLPPDSTYDAEPDASELDTDEDTLVPDAPPERGEQDDERWEEALPLNGVNVGDLVLPAISAAAVITSPASSTGASEHEVATNPFEVGQSYDWMKTRS